MWKAQKVSSDIAGAVRAKAVVNEGPIAESDANDDDDEAPGAGNIGVLKL